MSTSTPSSKNGEGSESISRKRCRECKKSFQPRTPSQLVCGLECAIKYGPTLRRQNRKKALKTRQEWLDDVQTVFNRYIRLRDQHLPCVSCGRHHKGQYHAGHYLSRGSHPELRFVEDNCHKQCQPCNNHKSGNQVQYRQSLIERIGEERVLWLEGPHDPVKYTIDDLEDMKKKYKKKAKEIESYFPASDDF